MAQSVKVPDTVHSEAERLADEMDMTIKEAIRHMCQSGEWDV